MPKYLVIIYLDKGEAKLYHKFIIWKAIKKQQSRPVFNSDKLFSCCVILQLLIRLHYSSTFLCHGDDEFGVFPPLCGTSSDT